ncbi:ACT domain-containing protein [Tepidibacillus infernus]|uniref:UPF0237 protein U473_02045 n=1 Tax=Tepidibacillus decaturensis TaxID=1413211 RepID=A0A135L1R6_9BACI|nr:MULTISPECIES: ACT domain-containing protein [Tepidibacillus]KXG42942.1 hypothetical protein U473_02045 [Tepidibacillus decaturensis]GBF10909.1 hypothetical protein HK1_00925 [Tepidibacillus sp. HK-1]
MNEKKAVVSVIGKDQIGIIAQVTSILAEYRINILDISQTILQDFFTMMMIVDLSNVEGKVDQVREDLNKLGEALGLKINVQLDEIFKAMHRI